MEKNKNEKPQIKKGVGFVFEQNPELANIGTMEQYSEYLDTIFSDSEVKNIVYHASHNKIENFREGMFGNYFSYSPIKGVFGNVINCARLDVKSLLTIPELKDDDEAKIIYDKEYRAYNNPSYISPEGYRSYKYDASLEVSTVAEEGVQIRVRNPEQIHVLGSEKDLENFKKFVANKNKA
jgi:hypothetical protein